MSSKRIHLCEKRAAILVHDGHQLILGGPGSGKTTIALIKAAGLIERSVLSPGQRILFLSFARATIARVAQDAREHISREAHSLLEINTYHSFGWALLKAHGYLTLGRAPIKLLTPPEAAARSAGTVEGSRRDVLRQVFDRERMLGFDLFAETTSDLLENSVRLRGLISDCYPIIVVDEFQDTDAHEWRLIKNLGESSRLIALADPEQRIYQFRGADPARISEFIRAFTPHISDFGTENNRSNGTDIVAFGNDVLTGANVGKIYTDVTVDRYGRSNEELSKLKFAVLAARRRLMESGREDWSLAILFGAKELMIRASDYLGSQTGTVPAIGHEVSIDPEGPTLAALLIAGILEGSASGAQLRASVLADVVAYIRGHKGGKISQADLALAVAIETYASGGIIRGKNRLRLLTDVDALVQRRSELKFIGDPEADWRSVRALIDAGEHEVFKSIATDSRYIRILHKGTYLREKLVEAWREYGNYGTARNIVSIAFQQEYFAASTRVWKGINLMTIHKAKGKEFDEVLIFEGEYRGRLLRADANASDIEQARLTLRVGVARARRRTLIMTPAWRSCDLL